MMDKFFEWFGRNRKTIGYTVGGLNVVNGLLGLLFGNVFGGLLWLVIGSAIIVDAKYFK